VNSLSHRPHVLLSMLLSSTLCGLRRVLVLILLRQIFKQRLKRIIHMVHNQQNQAILKTPQRVQYSAASCKGHGTVLYWGTALGVPSQGIPKAAYRGTRPPWPEMLHPKQKQLKLGSALSSQTAVSEVPSPDSRACS